LYQDCRAVASEIERETGGIFLRRRARATTAADGGETGGPRQSHGGPGRAALPFFRQGVAALPRPLLRRKAANSMAGSMAAE